MASLECGKAEVFLLQAGQVRRKDDAAGMAGPVQDVQRGVVFGQIGIAAIAEDAFDEIQIADQASGREEARLHGLLRVGAGRGADDRAQQQRDEQAHLLVLIAGEGQGQHVPGGRRAAAQQGREGLLGYRDFVGGNRQAAFDNVKNALGGAAVALGIVQDALRHAIGLHVGRGETVAPGGKDMVRAKPWRSSTKVSARAGAAPLPR